MNDETVGEIVKACANAVRVFERFAAEVDLEMKRRRPVLEEISRQIAEKAQEAKLVRRG